MRGSKYIQKNLLERLSARHEPEKQSSRPRLWDTEGKSPRHLSQFFKTAEHRKRQILEKMLME